MLRMRVPVPRFVSAGEIFVGPGSVASLRALSASRAVLLVSPSIVRDTALLEQLKKSVGALSLEVVISAPGEPSIESLQNALASVTEFGPDWLIAVGGGSVIDAGKVIWVLYEHPDIDLELISRPFALPRMRGRCRFAAVPTTAGTGAEVSSAAVLIDPATGRKRFVVSHELLPDVAVLDPRLMAGLPAPAMISASLDALAHAIEGYVSVVPNSLVDSFAHEAVMSLFRELPRGLPAADDVERRLALMIASLLAGWVQNHRPPGIGHAVAHQLGRYGAPHGTACGVLLPAAMRVNLRNDAVRRGYDRLAAHVGLGSADHLVGKVEDTLAALGVSRSLPQALPSAANATNGDRARIIADAKADICARTNAVPLDDALLNDFLDLVA